MQSLERGLAVIRAFDADHTSLTLSEVAARTSLTRAGARRFLLTLVDLDYIALEGRRFSLRPRVLEFGYSYLSSLSLPEIAGPHLEHLVSIIHESSSLSLLDGDDIVYVARVHTSRIMTMTINIGTRLPAYATSMGRVLLAGMEEEALVAYVKQLELERFTPRTVRTLEQLLDEIGRVRRQGYCIVDQEFELGLRSVAVPVHDGAGKVVAATNVSTSSSRGTLTRVRKELLPPLQETAARIEDSLRFHDAQSVP